MTQLQDHIRKLHQRQLPDEVPFNVSMDTSYKRYVRSPRGSARPSREATPEPGQASSSSMPSLDFRGTPFLQLPRGAHSLPTESHEHLEETEQVPVTLVAPVMQSSAQATTQERHAKSGAAKSSTKDGSSQQKKADGKAQQSRSTADSGQAESSGEPSLAPRPTYAEILSGRASPQPTLVAESGADDEPFQLEARKPHPEDSRQDDKDFHASAVQVPVTVETQTAERLNGTTQPVEMVQKELLSPTGESKRLTYAQVARMGSPVPGYEGVESRSEPVAGEDVSGGVRESGGVSKDAMGVVPQRTGADESGAGSPEQRQGTPLEEMASKKKAKKKRKGLPEEASAREPVGEGGGENAGRHSDGCLDPASKV